MKNISVRGFTLIEMSVVLTIIGLIIGAVIAGQMIVKQSKIRNTLSTIQQVTASVNTFKQKYGQLPGDLDNATSYWGTNPDCDGLRTGTATCDGDSDGTILGDSNIEVHLFWQHLDNAALISQHFRGNIGVGNYEENELKTAIDGLFLSVYPTITYIDPSIITTRKHCFILGGPQGDDNLALVPAISPTDAKTMDQKVDDGKPKSGIVSTEVGFGGSTACRTAASPPAYDTANPTNTCALIFLTDF